MSLPARIYYTLFIIASPHSLSAPGHGIRSRSQRVNMVALKDKHKQEPASSIEAAEAAALAAKITDILLHLYPERQSICDECVCLVNMKTNFVYAQNEDATECE